MHFNSLRFIAGNTYFSPAENGIAAIEDDVLQLLWIHQMAGCTDPHENKTSRTMSDILEHGCTEAKQVLIIGAHCIDDRRQ